MDMYKCGLCGIESAELTAPDRVCGDCVKCLRPTQKARDFVAWLQEKHPEVIDRAMLHGADDEQVQ
jgi:hypothetical protein